MSKLGKFQHYKVLSTEREARYSDPIDTVEFVFENITFTKKIRQWAYTYSQDAHIEAFLIGLQRSDKLCYTRNDALGITYATGLKEGDILTSGELDGNDCTVVLVDITQLKVKVKHFYGESLLCFTDLKFKGEPLIYFPDKTEQLKLLREEIKNERKTPDCLHEMC